MDKCIENFTPTIDDLVDFVILGKGRLKNISCEVKCPECGEFNDTKLWKECSVECEDCGDHLGVECPNTNCSRKYDSVFDPEIALEYRKLMINNEVKNA